MAKKRRRPIPDSADDDPLGPLMSSHGGVTLAGLLIVSGVIAVVGLVLTIVALTRETTSIVMLVIGGVLLLLAAAFLVMNVFNIGRRLEVRKHGIRYIESGSETEMQWDDISAIHVSRTDDTYMGPISTERRSSDSYTPSGPLTKTEWDVTIEAHDGRSIHLSSAFLRMVPDARKLINQMKLRTGL
jgi:hypothetical protein